MNIRWDAEKYRDNFSFVGHYGEALLDMIEGEDLSVLDLGCGNGNLTQKLAERGFHVTGLDGSDQQLRIAKKSCLDVHFLKADATDFHLEKPVDVVFSNAVLHWINPELQRKMLHCVYDALKPGGQFIFECGGYGCCASIHQALENEFRKRSLNYRMPFYFPTIGQYTPQMEEALSGKLEEANELYSPLKKAQSNAIGAADNAFRLGVQMIRKRKKRK